MRPSFTFQAVIVAGLLLAVAWSVSPNDGLAQTQRNVTVGVPRLFPPYYQLDEDGNPSGFAVDVMNEVAKQAGFEITYRVAETGGDNFEAIRAGDIDIIPSLGINDYRKQYVAFTQPVDTFRIVLFVRDDTQGVTGIDDMVGRPVAVVIDNVGYRFLEKRTDIQLKVFPTFTEALFALLSAKVDGFVYPEPVTLKLVREAGVSERIKAAAKPLLEIKRAMAVRKDNMELLAVLDRAIGKFIVSPEYQRIYVAWFGQPVPFWTLWRVVLAAGVLLVLSLMVMAWWRYRSVVRLNRALQEAEERFRAVVTYSPTKIHIKDAAGRYTLINPLAEKLFGVTDAEGRGKTTSDLFEEDVAAAYTAHDQTVMESGQAMEEEEEFILEDGVHTFLTTKFPIRDGFGKAIAIGAIGTDITDRKRTEEALRESEERFRGIFEQGAVGIAVMSPDGHFAQVNRAYCDFIGYQAEDLIGWHFDRVIHLDDMARVTAHWDAVMADATIARVNERRYHHKSGDLCWGLANLTVLRDPEGEITGYMVQVQDITERKQAEEALHTREAQLRGIMDNAPIQIVLKDTKGRYVLTNPQWQKSYSLTEEEAQGKTIRDLFPEEFANALSAHEIEVVKTGKTIIHEDQLPQADGVHDFITVKFPIRDATGELVNFGAMSVDITERKRAEEKIHMLNENLERRVEERTAELRESEEQIRLITNNVPVLISYVDRSGRYRFNNKTYTDWFGLSPDELVGREVRDVLGVAA